jgi:hypothetical protein
MLNLENVDTIVYPQEIIQTKPNSNETTFVTTVSTDADHILEPEFSEVDGRFAFF